MNAILTGATGFIGGWLAEELTRKGDRVTLIVRNKDKLAHEIVNSNCVTVIEKDIFNITEKDFHDDYYDVCYNLAWDGVTPEQKNNVSLQLHNIEATNHLLETCVSVNCKRFISSGTVAEYALYNGIIDVSAKQTPNDIYGAAKASAYYILEVRARQLGIPFNWIVIPSTFGERRTDNNIITYTIKTLLNKEIPQYGNLEQMWDFLYVGEVAKAIRLLAEFGKPNKVYGIGSGEYRLLREYISSIRDIIDPSLELGIGMIPSMSNKTFSSCVNIYDLIRDTGFKPEISFEEGIKKTVEWFKHKNN